MRGGHTVLQVPVPQLEPFVIERHRHYDRDFVSSDPRFVHAHITALGPFLPPRLIDAAVRSAIGEIARGVGEFTFRLARIDTFPNGIIHLVPEPEGPFRDLTARLLEVFPDCPPYAGEFPDVRPHLTLDARSPAVTVASTRRRLGDLVPATCVAERLDLAWYEAGGCRVLAAWPLAGGPDELSGPLSAGQRPAALRPAT
ncbi:2'-5' RNA ligase family protein [Intrasporangium sp.]|uniref:2'-5' RNA ligase family protein n=1 Tax=Intrasporangium sp. TaxID=1925024 RepID=UPI00293A46CB|nr:2'-5' RNA ligase family protein [Intrasporangium sp.]MDV3220824.1 2'-5' RNA ligase family protein [Intrasporangium sp.]